MGVKKALLAPSASPHFPVFILTGFLRPFLHFQITKEHSACVSWMMLLYSVFLFALVSIASALECHVNRTHTERCSTILVSTICEKLRLKWF